MGTVKYFIMHKTGPHPKGLKSQNVSHAEAAKSYFRDLLSHLPTSKSLPYILQSLNLDFVSLIEFTDRPQRVQ
jgi:hypothetical protein